MTNQYITPENAVELAVKHGARHSPMTQWVTGESFDAYTLKTTELSNMLADHRQEVIDSLAAGVELPPLPGSFLLGDGIALVGPAYYTTNQMQDYARAAIAIDRAKNAELQAEIVKRDNSMLSYEARIINMQAKLDEMQRDLDKWKKATDSEYERFKAAEAKLSELTVQMVRSSNARQAAQRDALQAKRAQPQPVPSGNLPERDPSKPAEAQGLFRKFTVQRTDGSDQPGGKHYGCEYFVLDVDHDQHAKAALQAYAAACSQTHPQLSADLIARHGAQPQPVNQVLLEALKLCYDHCRLYHPEVETNNVGEVVRAAIAQATKEGV